MKKIPIKCKGATSLPVAELLDFQGELKVLTDENYEKLKQEILTLGFSEPVSVWKDSKGKHHILNGHQRVHTIRKMLAEENFTCEPLPASLVEADSLKQAKEKVLALTSQYGTMTTDGLKTFLKEAGLKVDALDRFSFPEIDLPAFRMDFGPPQKDGAAADRETVTFDAYQNAAVKQIVLYFQAADYSKLIELLDQLMEKWKAEDYSQVVWRLAHEALRIKPTSNK